jgi:cellulase/cellobiase CelA1
LRVYSDWQTGFCGDITLVNSGGTMVTDWRLQARFPDAAFTQTWNAVYTPGEDSVYAVTPLSWNRKIWPYSTASIGFCARKTGPNYLPELMSVQSSM